jgi:hypothetical protein
MGKLDIFAENIKLLDNDAMVILTNGKMGIENGSDILAENIIASGGCAFNVRACHSSLQISNPLN